MTALIVIPAALVYMLLVGITGGLYRHDGNNRDDSLFAGIFWPLTLPVYLGQVAIRRWVD